MKNLLLGGWLAGCIVVLSACQNMKDDIDNLKQPIPTGVVMLQSEVKVQNGSSIQIPFRVNPSNYVVTKEHVALDVITSQITRTAYGTSIPEYTLTDIQPDQNSAGETIEGQWLAIVEATEGAYYGNAEIALVLDYTDAQGHSVQMTSTSVAVLNSYVKLSEEMVALSGPSACTYFDEGSGMPISTPVQLVAMPISEGSSTLFDLETISVESVKLTGAKADQFTLNTDEASTRKWTVCANSEYLEFDEGAQYVPITLEVTLKDQIGGNVVTITKEIRFFKTEYTAAKVEYKLSEWPSDRTQNIPLGDMLAQIGVTADLFTRVSDSESLPTVQNTSFGVKDATGTTSASAQYRALFLLKNTQADSDGTLYVVTAPETDYLNQRFYSNPLAGDYLLTLLFQYATSENIANGGQPTIKATIKIPVSILP